MTRAGLDPVLVQQVVQTGVMILSAPCGSSREIPGY